MKAFISFSGSKDVFFDIVGYWIDLMYDNDIRVSTTFNNSADHADGQFSTSSMIGKDFYVGLITVKGETFARALNEWDIAMTSNVPTILLLDDKVKLPEGLVLDSNRVIRFNRNNPQKAIQTIESQMAQCQPFTNEAGIPVISRIACYFCCFGALAIIKEFSKTKKIHVQKVKPQEAILAA